ncbi:MAG: LLM class flavin-dependent oxidoreductase [Actinomycetota bacterium]
MKVRFGFTIGPEVDAGSFGPIVDDLELLGFDSLWVPEILLQPTLDPIVALGVAAGRTRKLKLGTHLILPGRHPIHLARQLAHLDHLSDGRLLLLGVLGIPQEAEAGAQGIDRSRRGAAVDEMVPLLRRLWAGETVDHDGEFWSFRGAAVRPQPVQEPLEMWLAGQVPGALRRCARLGDGWMPGLVAPSHAGELRAALEDEAAGIGRTMDPEHYGANLFYSRRELSPDAVAQLAERRGADAAAMVPIGADALRGRIDEWLAEGFSKFLLRPLETPDDWGDELRFLADEILPLTV